MTQKIKSRRTTLFASSALAAALAVTGIMSTHTTAAWAEAVSVVAPQNTGFGDVVEKVTPAVVSVRVNGVQNEAVSSSPFDGFGDLPQDHPLNRFFKEFRGERGPDANPDRGQRRGDGRGQGKARPISQGSGFFISEDGYLVTNNHVIDGGDSFKIVMDDGTELDAKKIGSDPRTDLALLKVESDRKFTYVDFADDSKVRIGDWVVAIGNPFGLGGTVTAGIVSARGRDIGAGPYDDFIQIDAAVNRGNSGGPAFNLSGQVVGINTAIFSPSGGNVGIAFAIPASVAKAVIADLKDDGQVERGWLGVSIQQVTPDIAESLGLSKPAGAIVAEVQPDTPAAKAGIVAGDVIVSVGESQIADPKALSRLIAGIQPGKAIDVGVFRDGKAEQLSVTLGSLPAPDRIASAETTAPEPAQPSALDDFGFTVVPNEDGDGVVITDVGADSEAADKGVQAGDIVVTVNATPVKSAGDVEGAVETARKDGRKSVLLQVQTDGRSRFIALPIKAG
jgi:serine protease Do